jgi:ATP-dependent RNA helicase DeaD
MLTKEPDTTPVKLTDEAPLPQKRERKPYNDRDRRRKDDSRGYSSDRRKKAPVKPRTGEKRTGGKSSKPRSFNH